MGNVCYIACRDCKVVRSLGKFFACREVKTKAELENVYEFLVKAEVQIYRATSALCFMEEHSGHNCTLFRGSSDERLLEELSPHYDGSGYRFDAEELQL